MKMSMMTNLAGVLCCLLCALFIGGTSGSAIPMWEYLSKQEKTSYIYSLFANQVERFCDGSSIPLCSRQLLKYGLTTLKHMEEERLDAMDPYQRGSNNIIWETLMQGHRYQKTTPKPPKKATAAPPKPNSFEDESFSDYDDYGTQSAATGRLDNVYVVAPPKGFKPQQPQEDRESLDERDVPEGSGIVVLKTTATRNNREEEGGVFRRFQNQYRPVEVSTESVASSSSTWSTEERGISRNDEKRDDFINVPLTGRMVVRVYPDGRPVRENTRRPVDDDLRQYQLQRVKVPAF